VSNTKLIILFKLCAKNS